MLIQRLLLLALVATTVFTSGCVTNGRRILLKEYGPSVPVLADAPLKGVTICIKEFTCAPDLVTFELPGKPEEPLPFKYTDQSREEDRRWDTEMKSIQRKTKENAAKIGNMRNGFGMVMSHVYALNDPGAWLAESLKYDLEAQGAKVVDSSQAAAADVALSGTVQLCRVDMFMTVDASLVIDLELQPRHGEKLRRQVHTHGATAAMLASEGEYFHGFRDARQKFSIITTREILKLRKPAP